MPALALALVAAVAAAQPVDTPAEVVALCDAVSALPDGASTPPLRVVLAPEGLVVGGYDPDARRLALADRSRLTAAGGLLHVWVPGDAPLPVDADPAVAARVRDAAARRALTVALTFTAGGASDGERGCVRPAAAAASVLRVDPLGWEYRDGDAVVARGGALAVEPGGAAPRGHGTPAVEIGGVSGDGADEVRRAVEARGPALVACYRAALRRDPTLDGAVVVEVALDRPPDARGARIALDAVQDDRLAACVRDAVGAAPMPARPGRALVPIRFFLERQVAGGDVSSNVHAAPAREVTRSARTPSR